MPPDDKQIMTHNSMTLLRQRYFPRHGQRYHQPRSCHTPEYRYQDPLWSRSRDQNYDGPCTDILIQQISARCIQKLLSYMASTTAVVSCVHLRMRSLQNWFIRNFDSSSEPQWKKLSILRAILRSFIWWSIANNLLRGIPLGVH